MVGCQGARFPGDILKMACFLSFILAKRIFAIPGPGVDAKIIL